MAADLDRGSQSPPSELSRSRRLSNASTSWSVGEMQSIDPVVAIDALPRVALSAEELAKLLIPTGIKTRSVVRTQILAEGTTSNQLYNMRLNAFNLYKNNFGTADYMQPNVVLRRLFDVQNIEQVPDGPWRPDSVIYSINLTRMLENVSILMSEDLPMRDDQWIALNMLEKHFSRDVVGKVYSEDAFEVCLEIVRQLCIARVVYERNSPTFVPKDDIETVFFAGGSVFKHFNDLHMESLSEEQLADMEMTLRNSASEIIDAVGNSTRDTWVATMGELRQQYPWDGFVARVIRYYQTRKQELDAQITSVGGMDQLLAGFTEVVRQRSTNRAADEKRASLTRPDVAFMPAFGVGGIKALKARQRQLKTTAAAGLAAAATAPEAAPVAQMTDPALLREHTPAEQPAPIDDGYHHMENDHVDPTEPEVTAASHPKMRSLVPALASLQDDQRANARKAKGKGKSLLDRQEGAHRVEWDDSNSQVISQGAPNMTYPNEEPQQGPYYASSNKRPFNAMDEDEPAPFDPTQDAGFESDTRDIQAANLRRQQAPQTTRLPQRTISSSIPGPSGTDSAETSPRPSKTARQSSVKNPGSTIPPPFSGEEREEADPATQDYNFERARNAARFTTVRTTQNKPVQVRTPWSDVESTRLMDLIVQECHDGISYSHLKALDNQHEDGPRLMRRSPEDMRWRARVMKEIFLKAGEQLPANFDHVALGKKEIEKLHRCGIEYHQERRRGGPAVLGME